jgi:hypothetical protein
MKNMLLAFLVTGALMSCGNNANDGDASTDTTTFDATPADTSTGAPLGDTSLDLNNQGTLSNPNTRTDVDTAGTGTRSDTGTRGGGMNQQ